MASKEPSLNATAITVCHQVEGERSPFQDKPPDVFQHRVGEPGDALNRLEWMDSSSAASSIPAQPAAATDTNSPPAEVRSLEGRLQFISGGSALHCQNPELPVHLVNLGHSLRAKGQQHQRHNPPWISANSWLLAFFRSLRLAAFSLSFKSSLTLTAPHHAAPCCIDRPLYYTSVHRRQLRGHIFVPSRRLI